MARKEKRTKNPSSSKIEIKPTAGYALVEPLEIEKKTAGGIVLPDTHDEKSQRGVVIAMGQAPVSDSGKKKEAEFKVGDKVVYKKWGGDEFKYGLSGKELIFVKFDDILGVLKE